MRRDALNDNYVNDQNGVVFVGAAALLTNFKENCMNEPIITIALSGLSASR